MMALQQRIRGKEIFDVLVLYMHLCECESEVMGKNR